MKFTPRFIFVILNILGLSLMFAHWSQRADTLGFLLLLLLIIMSTVRYRLKDFKPISKTIFIDLLAVIIYFFMVGTGLGESALNLVLFQSMALGFYPVAVVILYLVLVMEMTSLTLTISFVLLGLLLNFWQQEQDARLLQRDILSKENYDLESLQSELTTALAQVESMSIIAERSRISSDIHDNAGHEIVAAFISLQTVGKIMAKNPEKAAELFDKSMERLGIGVAKMRDAVHNMAPVTFMGVERMNKICELFERVPVKFVATGDMTGVTSNAWNVLEAVLNESLTNVMRHSQASFVRVELDVTKYLVRLQVENDGVIGDDKPLGSGLRNLRHRATTVGGNLTVDKGKNFKLVCVIPVR